MNPIESSHARSPMPTPGSGAATGLATRQLFSTKLKESQDAPESSTSPLKWFQDKVISPAQTRLRQIDVGPMVDTLRDVRSRLAFSPSSPSAHDDADATSFSTNHDLRPAKSPLRGEPPLDDFSLPASSLTATMPPMGEVLAQADCSAIKGVVTPPEPSIGEVFYQADCSATKGTAAPPTKGIAAPLIAEEPQPLLRQVEALQSKFSAIEEKVAGLAFGLSETCSELNTGFDVTCDRFTFEMQQNQDRQDKSMRELMATFKNQLALIDNQHSAAMSDLQKEHQGNMQSLTEIIAFGNAEPAARRVDPFVPADDANEDAEANAALAHSQQFFMDDAASIEDQIVAQFNIKEMDPETFKRHKEKFADVRSFSEAALHDDPSIETNLSAAMKLHGAEKATALQALRVKLGKGSHRNQQLGDLMLLYLLSRQSADATVKDSIAATCRDFVAKGHTELFDFSNRCRAGQSFMPSQIDPDLRSKAMTEGMQAVQRRAYCENLLVGIIFRLGYSNTPACEFKAQLALFKTTTQQKGEKTFDFVNRLSNTITKMQSTARALKKTDCVPKEGEWLQQLKQGARKDVRLEANKILAFKAAISNAPQTDPSFADFTAAILQADSMIATAADEEKSLKTPIFPPVQSPEAGDTSKVKQSDQDPALTFALKIHTVCVNHVAHSLGKSMYPCTKQDCQRKHVRPEEVGLRSEDYKDFAAIPSHIITRVPPEFVVADARKFKGIGVAPAGSVASPAVGSNPPPTAEEPTEKLIPEPAAINAPLISMTRTLISGAQVPHFMRGSTTPC